MIPPYHLDSVYIYIYIYICTQHVTN
jgi:hypothetical protein